MKKLLFVGIVMVFAAGLFAEPLTLTGVVEIQEYNNKNKVKKTRPILSSDSYKTVRFAGKKCEAQVIDYVGKTVTLDVDAIVKNGKHVRVKTINSIK